MQWVDQLSWHFALEYRDLILAPDQEQVVLEWVHQVLEGKAEVFHDASLQVKALKIEQKWGGKGRLEHFAANLDVFGMIEDKVVWGRLLPINFAEQECT